MEWFIVALIVIAAWHAVYEGIVAPTARMRLRFYMFEIRDDLRLLKIQAPGRVSDEAFQMLEESINNAIKLMARITLSEVSAASRELGNDPHLEASVEKRLGILDSCEFEEFQHLRMRSAQIFMIALVVNSGGWAVYVVPVLAPVLFYNRVISKLRHLMSLPGYRVDQVFTPLDA